MTEIHGGPEREQVKELTDTASGVWRVFTRDSSHTFDMDDRTVLRSPGKLATNFGLVLPTRLDYIGTCQVGKRGSWFFAPLDPVTEPHEYLSSTVQRIERLDV
ncbi:hypothetical protein E3T61_03040 [Cryobacterium lactosi]|uniref:Uncharacterized protein n=1 Tax=Cryobacterium lactosi TaxID=1259202 RepID=A0A4R9BZ29_9MICO|nr:hypothetical protein [Cryobacterium lactosi]TFD93990.1 hypothetical protein E3T61_03040 [Cryobacterium lactosi]